MLGKVLNRFSPTSDLTIVMTVYNVQNCKNKIAFWVPDQKQHFRTYTVVGQNRNLVVLGVIQQK